MASCASGKVRVRNLGSYRQFIRVRPRYYNFVGPPTVITPAPVGSPREAARIAHAAFQALAICLMPVRCPPGPNPHSIGAKTLRVRVR